MPPTLTPSHLSLPCSTGWACIQPCQEEQHKTQLSHGEHHITKPSQHFHNTPDFREFGPNLLSVSPQLPAQCKPLLQITQPTRLFLPPSFIYNLPIVLCPCQTQPGGELAPQDPRIICWSGTACSPKVATTATDLSPT